MSQSDDFLSRWSRRKQQAARETARLKDGDKAAIETGDKATDDQVSQRQTEPEPSAAEPVFDLSKLPSLDSIGPDTDLSVFMQPGVPASLSRAALRRAWSADPSIRDFIGLSENSWDFTKPETITGFGQLLPIDDVQKMLARVLSNDEPASAYDEEVQQTALQQSDTAGEHNDPDLQGVGGNCDSEASTAALPEPSEDMLRRTKNNLGSEPHESADAVQEAGSKRRRGGALPS